MKYIYVHKFGDKLQWDYVVSRPLHAIDFDYIDLIHDSSINCKFFFTNYLPKIVREPWAQIKKSWVK